MKECFINIEVTRSVLSEDRTENSTFMTSLDIIQGYECTDVRIDFLAQK